MPPKGKTVAKMQESLTSLPMFSTAKISAAARFPQPANIRLRLKKTNTPNSVTMPTLHGICRITAYCLRQMLTKTVCLPATRERATDIPTHRYRLFFRRLRIFRSLVTTTSISPTVQQHTPSRPDIRTQNPRHTTPPLVHQSLCREI